MNRSNARATFSKNLTSLLVAGLFYGMLSVANAASPEVNKARDLVIAGKPEAALEILEPLEDKLAGDPEYDYLLGLAALNANQPSKATFVFERVLAVAPEYIGVRADMGKAYYLLGDYARAKIEFETILTFKNLPPDLKGIAEKYMAALQGGNAAETNSFTGYVELGFGRDTNVFSATRINPVMLAGATPLTIAEADRPKHDNYQSLNTGFEFNAPLGNGISAYAGVDFRGRFYRNYDTGDNGSLDGRVGLTHSSGNTLISGGLLAGYYALDNRRTRTSLGLNLDVRHAIDAGNQLLAGTSLTRYEYSDPDARSNDNDTYSANLGWYTTLSTTSALTTMLTGGHETGFRDRADGGKDFVGLRLTLQGMVAEKVGAYASLGGQAGRYNKINTTYDLKRHDETYDLSVGLSWTLPDRWSLRPQLALTRNTSNTGLNDYRKADLSVNLRKDF